MIELPYDSVIPLLDIYPKDCKSGYSRDTCTMMIIAALFTISKLKKQPRCLTINEWMKKIWYIYTVELYLAIRTNEGKCMQLEDIMLSEVSQAQKPKSCIFSTIHGR
jgi:hypothetical protein